MISGKKIQFQEDDLPNITLESQSHPAITPASPFELLIENGDGPQTELKGDVHYCLQFSIVLAGSAEVVFGNWKKVFSRDQAWWTMCWEPHAFRLLSRKNVILSININIDNIGRIGPCSDIDWMLPFTMEPSERYCPESLLEKQQMRSLAKQLYHLHCTHPAHWKVHSWLLIHQILLCAAEKLEKKSSEVSGNLHSEMSRIQKSVQLVRTCLIPPSLREAAAACSLSVSRFSVLFSSAMGVSYGQFALRVRLSNAAQDVKSGLFTLNEIAERHGFCDASSFCNAFKKLYRCTPNEFKSRSKYRNPGK